MHMQHFPIVYVSYLSVVNSNGVTCECNLSFLYLKHVKHEIETYERIACF